ncbi:hypothetical protein HA402_006061 [Bradysia odoriphaga]|nr:hypothetical protein HA402_006061 [Bradysia odoriphaga]
MCDKVATDQLCPDSLFDMSLRVFAKDIHKTKPNIIQCLPNCIKRVILKYVTGYLSQTRKHGLRNKKTIKALLNREVTNLNLRDSVTTDSILHVISQNCVHLRELTLGGPYCHIKRKTLQNFIPRMKHLTVLCLKDVDNVTDKSITGLTELKHLKHLNLKNCVNLTDECGKILRNLKLEKLDMSHNGISDQWLDHLPNSPLNDHLIDLNLSYCSALSNHNFGLLNWSKLKYVGLPGLTGLDFMDNLGRLKFVQWTVPF